MPKYLIQRTIPNASELSPEELHAISAKSNGVIRDLRREGAGIQWDHSYVVDDALYCVYVAPNAEAIREHARCGGFPCDKVMRVDSMIDPVSGE